MAVDEKSTEMTFFFYQIVESGRIRRKRRRFCLISSTKSSIAFGGSKKRTQHLEKQARHPKNTPLPTKSPSGDDLRRGGLVNQLLRLITACKLSLCRRRCGCLRCSGCFRSDRSNGCCCGRSAAYCLIYVACGYVQCLKSIKA